MYRTAILITALAVLTPTVADAAPARHRSQASAVWRDPGVDVGVAKGETQVLAEPDPGSDAIGSLKTNDWAVLVTRKPSDGWLNVIAMSSGRQGFVRANRLTVHYTSHPKAGLRFHDQATSGDDAPTVSVKNDSGKGLFLHINGSPETFIDPHSEQSVSVPAGIYSYNVTAPSVLPLFGHMAFVNGDRYDYTFFIGKETRGRRKNSVDPALKSEAHELQIDINKEVSECAILERALDAEKANLRMTAAKVKSDREDVEIRKRTVDQSKQSDIDAYNQAVDDANRESEEYQKSRDKCNTDIDAYNAKVSALQAKRDRLEEIAEEINTASTR